MNRWLITHQFDIEPEELLVIAIFRQAAIDLCCPLKKWRQDALSFFKHEGFTSEEIKRVREVWRNR